jgi:hypothetical protein
MPAVPPQYRKDASLEEANPHVLDRSMMAIARARSFFAPKLRQVGHFLTRQGIAVAGNLLYGLLCVRMLPVSDYAKFAVLFGYMGSLIVLLDIGVSSALAPLVGEQIDNLPLIANYVASIRRLALWVFFIIAPLASICFVWLVQRQHWGPAIVIQMLIALLTLAWFARVSASYGSVLLLRRDRARYYRIQIIGSLGSLGLLLIFWLAHRMNVYVGILLNMAQVIFLGTSYYFRAQQLLGVKGQPSRQQERAIVRLAMPNMPSAIFYATQGQFMLMLITFFGHASAVADMGALNRLFQITGFFTQMNPVLVEPFFARLQQGRLKRAYLAAVAIIALCSTAYTGLAFLYPGVFLWILGPKYSSLRLEVSLVILSSAIQYLAGFMWVMNSARCFIYWWNNLSHIILTLSLQVFVVWKFNLSTVRSVLYLNIACATLTLLVTIAVGIYGFVFGPQRLESQTETLESPTA